MADIQGSLYGQSLSWTAKSLDELADVFTKRANDQQRFAANAKTKIEKAKREEAMFVYRQVADIIRRSRIITDA